MKMKLIEKRVLMLSMFLLVCTPLFIYLANLNRIKKTFGGEALIWMFPYLIYILLDTRKEMKRCEK